MASINYSSNFIAICVASRIYLLQQDVSNGCWNIFLQLDLNSLELNTKKEQNNPEVKKLDENKHIILCSALSNDFKFLTVATNTKVVILFNLTSISTIQPDNANNPEAKVARLLPFTQQLSKTPTEVYFSSNDEIIFLSDRSGSVYEFKIAESGLSEGQKLLGHLSMLLDFCFSPDGKFILTTDRDEKIRISHYPQTFVIESFCLGSTSFVKTISCLDDSLAVSAGGDSVIRLWNFKHGICLFTSSKICDAPIRKIRPIKIKNGTRIIVLPDGRNLIILFALNEENQTLSLLCSINCEDIDEKFHDFCIDTDRGAVYCLGKKCIYFSEIIESDKLELRPINAKECGAMMWKDLEESEEKYPLDEFYKVVNFGNAENYQKVKKAKIVEKNQNHPRADFE